MSVHGTYTTRTAALNARRASARPGGSAPSWLSVLTLVLLLAILGVGGTLAWVRLTGGARDSAAVRRIVTAERAYWQNASPQAATATDGKKKRKKPGVKPAPSTAALNEGVVPILQLQGKYTMASLKEDNQRLNDKLATFAPADVYITIDTANNHLYLKNGQKMLLDALCSTGSYTQLTAADGRKWFFHTPRGQFKVQRKIKNPVWVKPDWGFVEEGKPIPGAKHESRFEPYVMGDYALAFGNGYYIHGTLYRRLIGESVTHGCVRLGDEELETVFNTAPVGTPIFIY